MVFNRFFALFLIIDNFIFDIGAKFVNAIISSQDVSAFGQIFTIIFQWEQLKYLLPIIGSLVTTVGIAGATG